MRIRETLSAAKFYLSIKFLFFFFATTQSCKIGGSGDRCFDIFLFSIQGDADVHERRIIDDLYSVKFNFHFILILLIFSVLFRVKILSFFKPSLKHETLGFDTKNS